SSYSFASFTGYFNAVATSSNGFLKAANTTLNSGQSDRLFTSRQDLMKILLQGTASTQSDRANIQNALPYLTHFSRDLNQPSYIHAVQTSASAPVVLDVSKGGNSVAIAPYVAGQGDKLINPNFPSIR